MTVLESLDDRLLAIDPQAADVLFRQARSTTRFADESVGDEQIQAAYELVKWGPTAMNGQPLRITLIRSEAARRRLIGHMAPGNRAKVADAPAVVVLTADRHFHEHLPTLFPHAPAAKDAFDDDAERREASARFNAGLQVAYFILGVRAVGLAAGPMTGMNAAAIEADLFPDGDQAVLAVVVIGKPLPQPQHPRGPRLAYTDVVRAI